MKVIVGLGNIGKEYEDTRHNAGFIFLDELAKNPEAATADQNLIQFHTDKKFVSSIAEIKLGNEKIILVKPNTYMNASGKAVSLIAGFYKIDAKDLIVIMDDVDLPIGTVRFRKEGSSGGHKGLQNIIDALHSDEFLRIRLGISNKAENKDAIETAEYVLDKFSKREKPIMMESIHMAIDRIIPILKENKEVPCHTFDVAGKEQGIAK